MNTFVVANPNKCIGCRTCEVACVVAHSEKNIFTQEGDIEFNPRLSVVKTAKVSAPIQCRHCEDAPCASVCPKGAITNEDGVIYIDKNNCVGCKACLIACPVGAIDMAPEYKNGEVIMQEKLCFKEKMVANKCDLCKGIEGGPACVKVCPTDAFEIIKSEDIEKSIKDKRKQVVMELVNML